MNNIHDDSGNNNTPDYENNLAFDPTSADDLNEQGRQSEVLIKAIEKCERLEKENQRLKEKLEKAEATLLEIDGSWVTDEIRSKVSEYFVHAIGEKK